MDEMRQTPIYNTKQALTAGDFRIEYGGVSMQYLIIALYVLFSVSGVVFFKMGSADAMTLEVSRSNFSVQISWLSVIGLASYVISFLIYMGLVSKNDLSYLMPVVTGAVYLLTMCASVLIFKERIQCFQLLGSVLILAGLILMNVKSK